tara:strand:- start:785 stop:982 length:198 start_codon:yes stop_codon:yes gene_type:complete
MMITSAKYLKAKDDKATTIADSDNQAIIAVIDGIPMTVPLSTNNRHYAEIMRQVDAGELTIQEAD